MYGSPVEGDMTTTGTPLATPPLIDMISNDPILGDVKVTTFSDFCCASTISSTFIPVMLPFIFLAMNLFFYTSNSFVLI